MADIEWLEDPKTKHVCELHYLTQLDHTFFDLNNPNNTDLMVNKNYNDGYYHISNRAIRLPDRCLQVRWLLGL